MKTDSRLFSFLKRTYYPVQAIRLLQKAELAPLAEARQAWCQWRDLDRLDEIGWQEQKILARMHGRIRELDPGYIHLPRVMGLLKSEWTRSQFRLKASLAAVDLLLAHEYRLMLFKGLAWDKRCDAKGIRLSGDLDVLVPEKDFINVLTLLEQNGWTPDVTTHWTARSVVPDNMHGINYTNEKGGNIDVHRRPVHARPESSYLDGLWKRSERGTFMGRPVYYCSHADYLAFLIAHGVGENYGENMSSLWPGDLHRAVAAFEVGSMADFRSIIRELGIPLECEFALAYCRDVLQSDRVAGFSRNVGPFDVSVAALVRAVLNSPPAFTRGTLIWIVAGSIRRLSRFFWKVRYDERIRKIGRAG